jgi:hypothetical protein
MGSTVVLSQSNRGHVVQNIPQVYINLVGLEDVTLFTKMTESACVSSILYVVSVHT